MFRNILVMGGEYCSWDRAIDENWYHILIPRGQSLDTEMIRGLENYVPIKEIEPSNFDYLKRLSIENNNNGYENCILEKVVGCETGCVLFFSGDELLNEISDIRERLEHRKLKK